jgi:hypothetical protein
MRENGKEIEKMHEGDGAELAMEDQDGIGGRP